MADARMKTKLFAGVDMEMPLTVTPGTGNASVITRPRPGRTSPNEDAAAVIPGSDGCCVLAVADGLGGLPAGDAAARTVLQCLADRLEGVDAVAQREAMLTGLEQANAAILSGGSGGATTVAVAAIDGNTVRTAIAGDSMIVVCGQRGRVKYQSVPHSPIGYAEASGMLNEDEAMFHRERHLVSNMVGQDGMHVEVGPLIRLAPRDTVILGSDGLFDNLYIGEIVELVRCGPLDAAARSLQLACEQRMRPGSVKHPHKPDDLTFILYRL